MEDTGTVCSMCGDVGFSDELFQCRRCLSRFQHSYCSNYYDEEHNSTAGVCDWCLSEERSEGKHGLASTKHAGKDFSGDNKMKRSSGHEESASRGKSSGSSPSAKSGGRRYKLLKDVL